ncbi:MAG: Fic family protein [Thermoplasmata archaeon]|nr:Fic family protein [Thermoplasmata archaeon]
MAYTEVQKRGNKNHYYRARSVRDGKKVTKKRIFLGTDLSEEELAKAELDADRELGILDSLLSDEDIALLDSIKQKYAQEPEITKNNRYETFITLFTHDSTSIEGNTLTLQEAGSLLFDDASPTGKTLREINEIIGHKKAFDFMLDYDEGISRKFICELHSLTMKDTTDEKYMNQIGSYRTVQVFIRGLDWTPPPPKEVQNYMRDLLTWYSKNKKKAHPLVAAIYFHVGFEIVHPFIDGNGRVGRILMNFILHKNGYPMVNIPNKEKNRYYKALQEAQMEGNLRPFIDMMLELMKESDLMF